METLELWSYDVSGDLGNYAEHTYVRCPGRNEYFNCWGNHASPTQGQGVHRFSCEGIYEVANCYRRDSVGAKDTAGLGVYGVNGVCHQSANLFLFSTGRAIAIADGVKGYAITSFTYGIYGNVGPLNELAKPIFVDLWKETVYNPCYRAYIENQKPKNTLFEGIKQLYKSVANELIKVNPLEMIHQEAAVLTRHAVPGADPDRFKDIHLDFLKETRLAMAKIDKPVPLAEKINDLAVQFQNSLAVRIGEPAYQKLTGMGAGETVNVIDPNIAAAVQH